MEFILDHISDPLPTILQSSLAKANGEIRAASNIIVLILRLFLQMCDYFSFICDITFNRLSTLRWRWCNRALLRLVQREAEVKTTCLCFKSIQPCYSRFSRRFPKYIPLKILSTNESRLYPGSRHSGDKEKKNQTVRCEMIWAELCFSNN